MNFHKLPNPSLLLKTKFVTSSKTVPSFQSFLLNKRSATNVIPTISKPTLIVLHNPLIPKKLHIFSASTLLSPQITQITYNSHHYRFVQHDVHRPKEPPRKGPQGMLTHDEFRNILQKRVDQDRIISPFWANVLIGLLTLVFGTFAYFEIYLPTSNYQVFHQSFDIIEQDPEVIAFLGPRMYGYGMQSILSTENREVQWKRYINKDGKNAILLKYVVEGNLNSGYVWAERVIKSRWGDSEWNYILVEVPQLSKKIVVIKDGKKKNFMDRAETRKQKIKEILEEEKSNKL